MKEESQRCHSPSFVVRLSGTGLYLLDSVNQNQTHTKHNKHYFTFPSIIDPGTYFIEVMVIFCSTIDPQVHDSKCMENVQFGHNVLNLPYHFNVSHSDSKTKRPRWMLNNSSSSSFLPTRYQKVSDCIMKNGFCETKPKDIEKHLNYEWTDFPGEYMHTIRKLIPFVNKTSFENQPQISICMIGSSHVREIGNAGIRMQIEGIKWLFSWTTFPATFDAGVFYTLNCSYAIVTYGQWPFGYLQPDHKYSLKNYEMEMRQVISKIVNRSNALDTQVFMLGLNYNSLGARYTSCLPIDLRSPIMINHANSIVEKLSLEYGLGFIDVRHISGALWDVALDWDHPYGKVFSAEAGWVLHYMFDHSMQHHNLPAVRYARYIDYLLIRFTDSKSVYLYKDNCIRKFPDGHTFMGMGFSFEDVITQTEYNKQYYVLGPDLRHI